MTIIPEQHIEEAVEFLEQDSFEARKIVIVADVITRQEGGRGHKSARGYANGNALCYEDKKWIPK